MKHDRSAIISQAILPIDLNHSEDVPFARVLKNNMGSVKRMASEAANKAEK